MQELTVKEVARFVSKEFNSCVDIFLKNTLSWCQNSCFWQHILSLNMELWNPTRKLLCKRLIDYDVIPVRSCRPEVFCKKDVLRNFAKSIGKHLCQSLFFNKVASLPTTLLKKRLWHRCFPVNFAKFLRTPFFTKHFRWRLLSCILSIDVNSLFASLN